MAYRILVVAGANEMLRELPVYLGGEIEARVLDTADDALWEVRANPPEAIIADVELEGMSGLELAEIMPNFDVPTRVLLWSRAGSAAARQQAEGYGVFRFLSGPVSADELRAAVQEAVAAAPAPAVAEEEAAPMPERPAEETPPGPDEPAQPRPEPAPQPAAEAPAGRFKPARVVLPPVEERVTSTPPRSGGGLAARSTRPAADKAAAKSTARPAAPRPAAPRPAPAPPSEPAKPVHQHRAREGTLVLTTDNLEPIKKIMSQLSQDLGAQSIMLTNREGMVLVEVGTTHGLPMMIVLPLFSTTFSTAGEIARQLHEEDATTLYIQEGVNYDLYCFDVAQRFLLVLVFNKKVASSKIGAVWVNAKRVIRELRDALS